MITQRREETKVTPKLCGAPDPDGKYGNCALEPSHPGREHFDGQGGWFLNDQALTSEPDSAPTTATDTAVPAPAAPEANTPDALARAEQAHRIRKAFRNEAGPLFPDTGQEE